MRFVRYHDGTLGCSSIVDASVNEDPCVDCCCDATGKNECCVPARSDPNFAVSTSLSRMNILTVTFPRMPSHRSRMAAGKRDLPVATDCNASRDRHPASRDSEKK